MTAIVIIMAAIVIIMAAIVIIMAAIVIIMAAIVIIGKKILNILSRIYEIRMICLQISHSYTLTNISLRRIEWKPVFGLFMINDHDNHE